MIMKKVELSDEQIEELITFFKAKIDSLNKQKFEIEVEISNQKKLISNLSGNYQEIENKMRRTNITWRQAAINVLEEKNELLPTSEILEEIELKYPRLTEGKERRSSISSLSGTLSMAIDKEQLSRFEKPDENYYGLNEWFSKNFPKEEFIEKINKRGYNFQKFLL
jgi:hypothetical protein